MRQNSSQRRGGNIGGRCQAQLDPVRLFAHDVQILLAQEVVHLIDAARDGVFDGKKARSTVPDTRESITCLSVGKPTKRPSHP